jgi:ubiquinone/menaquinone biosynthesis C-methylase UbiE
MSKSDYDRIAPCYDEGMKLCERLGLVNLRKRLIGKLPAGSRVLEVGAGTGLNFAHYPIDARGAAIEPSWEMLSRARLKSKPPSLSLVQARAEELPFPDNSFDAALATLVFCSVASPAVAIADIRRVVKPGGPVLLLEHVRPPGVLGPVFDLMNLITEPLCGDHLNRRTAEIARKSGLRNVEVERRLMGIINLIVGYS